MRLRQVVLSLSLLLLPIAAWSKTNPSYTQFGHDIYIGPEQQVGELTCFGCSIHIRGQVTGDATTFGGGIAIEDQAQVAGDITVFGGNLRVDKGVKVAGDATVFAGEIRRAPEAQVAGDVTAFGGHGWLIPLLLAPLVVIGLIVGFVIWLVQRMRSPAQPITA